MDIKQYEELVKAEKSLRKLALRIALALEMDNEENEELLVNEIVAGFALTGVASIDKSELNSEELADLLEATSISEDQRDAKVKKYLPSFTFAVGKILWGENNLINAARAAVLSALVNKSKDVTFFIDKRYFKRRQKEQKEQKEQKVEKTESKAESKSELDEIEQKINELRKILLKK